MASCNRGRHSNLICTPLPRTFLILYHGHCLATDGKCEDYGKYHDLVWISNLTPDMLPRVSVNMHRKIEWGWAARQWLELENHPRLKKIKAEKISVKADKNQLNLCASMCWCQRSGTCWHGLGWCCERRKKVFSSTCEYATLSKTAETSSGQ